MSPWEPVEMKVSGVNEGVFFFFKEKKKNIVVNFECFINYLNKTSIIILMRVMLESLDLKSKKPLHYNNYKESKLDD